MALFKISKGLAKNLMANVPYAKEGFAYFTTDDGKLYIDIAGDGTSIQAKKGTNRICLNSDYADRLKINSNATKAKDNQVARFNGNDGSLQGSDVTIDDEGALVATKIYATDIRTNETTGKTEIADIDVEKYDFGVVGASYFQGNVDIKGNITLNGDAMTGNLKFQKTNSDGTISTTATIGATTGYITGTRLQTTSVGNKAGDFATIDSSGWIYKRTAAQVLSDIGAATSSHNHDSNYVKKSGDTMTGLLKTNGSIENQGEAKFTHPTYCPEVEDTAESIGFAFKASRGHFNQMNVNEIYLPATTTTSYTGNKISFKSYSGGNNGAYANVSEVASINKQGFTIPGTDTADRYFRATNSNGSIGLLTSTNQGLYDYTNRKWIVYHNKSDGINYFNGLATKATQDKNGLQIDSNYLKLSGGTVTGEVAFTNANAIRFVNGTGTTKSILMRNDGSNFYIVPCNATSGNSWYIPSGGSEHSFRLNLSNGFIHTTKLYGAVWNDYAEFRKGDTIEAGRCVVEVGNDTLITSTERMMPGANITSDTFGFAIGETEQAKTPIAVSGRVLAYPYESREEFKKNIGRPVCSGPNGTISIMTDEEYRDKGYCAIGTISAVPDYEGWGSGNVKVDGRVWIKVF